MTSDDPQSQISNPKSKIETELFGELTPEAFLDEYWQQKPLLVRNALPDFRSPLAPEELAGLACEDGVTSRLILEEGGAYPWEVRFGPFAEEAFLELPETHWTLLVQEVDRLVPEVARLLDRFTFVPNWRIDDVMVSYAPEHGTVGPHIDSYDVFLVQGLGRRRWQIGTTPLEEERFVEDLDVRILEDFSPDEEWIVETGDLLYLPPRIPHYGVALGDCMTYSVGFRAPSQRDLATGFLDYATAHADDEARFSDPDRTPPEHPGLLPASDRAQIRAQLRRLLDDDAALDRWFGRYITRPQRGSNPAPASPPSPGTLREQLQEGAVLRRSAPSDFAYILDDKAAVLFAAGKAYSLEPAWAHLASRITGPDPLTAEALGNHLTDESLMELLAELVSTGALWIERPS